MDSTATNELLKNLSNVGRFLEQISDETREQTEYFVAKTSLDNIKASINNLNPVLDSNVINGLDSLISYLEKKTEKRKRQANGEFFQG